MRISDAALNVIMAALLNETGFDRTGYEVRTALEELAGGGRINAGPSDLQPGEEYWLIEGMENDSDSCAVNTCKTREALNKLIDERVDDLERDTYSRRDNPVTGDEFDILIVRKRITPQINRRVEIVI